MSFYAQNSLHNIGFSGPKRTVQRWRSSIVDKKKPRLQLSWKPGFLEY